MFEKASLPEVVDVVTRFENVPTGLITDAFSRLNIGGWMDCVLPLVSGTRVVGRARTVAFGPARRVGKPSESMYALISRMAPGDVLVMGAGGTTSNMMGDNMGAYAHRHGLAGVVTDANTRDRAGLREIGLPIFSRGAAVRPPFDVELRAYDVDIDCGGAQVRPGDIIVGDDDGVVVVPPERAADVLFQIEDIIECEEGMDKAIRGGASVEKIEALLARKKALRKVSNR